MSEGSGYASRDAFLAPAKRRFKDVVLPVNGSKVKIRSLFDGEKEAYEAELLSKKDGNVRKDMLASARRRLFVLCICDGSGEPLLSSADLDSLKQIDGADAAVLQEECQTHVGFKPGDIEGLVKNSEGDHANGS